MQIAGHSNDRNVWAHTYSGGNNIYVDSDSVDDGQWHHLVLKQDDTNVYLYVDNNLLGSTEYSLSGTVDPDINLSIGGFPITSCSPDDNFEGLIDEVRIYNRSLSTTEIQQLYTISAPTPNVAPTASITASSTTGTSPLTVTLDSSGSTDSDGSIASYSWSTSDGQTATGSTASLQFTTAGSHTVTLTVTDDDSATGTATETITVTEPANLSPTALITATPDSGTTPLTVALDGSGSTDSDGTISSYNWGTSDGQTATGSTASLQFTTAGSHTVTLTVTDDDGATGTATETITVTEPANLSPTALITATPDNGTAPLTIALGGSGSTDSDGSIASYSWSSSDGQSAIGSTASLQFTTAGSHTVTLTVTDNDGATGSATETITVAEPANLSPTALITATPNSGTVPLTVLLDASASTDSDGTVSSYSWSASDGQTATDAAPSLTFNSAGEYLITLVVTDNDGATSTTTTTVTAADVHMPVAAFTATPMIGSVPLTVTLDGSGSTTPNGSIVAYQWSSRGGQDGIGSTASFTFDEVGTYTITHTVVDSSGLTGSSAQDITVTEALTATITATPTSGVAPLTVALDGSGSTTPNSSIIAYNWSSSDGQLAVGSRASLTYDSAGSYTITLTIIDDGGDTATATETITVQEETASLGYNPTARPSPQVIAGGISPSQIDLNDTELDIMAIVRPGILSTDRVTFQSGDQSFALEMVPAGVLANGDELYKVVYNFARGAFAEQTLPTLWGADSDQFNVIAYDTGEVTSHKFPNLMFGNFPAQTVTTRAQEPLDYLTTKRRGPQVIMGGLSPSKIDLNDTEFDVIAFVRDGILPIEQVSVSQVEGSFGMEMNASGLLDNGDRAYKITYTFQRGTFPAGTVLNALWGDRFGQFNITVVDQAQQRSHNFPDIIFGNFPAQ
jgi:PKD repeat protein